ncbi:MAG: potassium transporter TrkA [Micromonosporaceae bacterium]|nr:potassium transporter TrkA [Micromonosporaceae bacterium]
MPTAIMIRDWVRQRLDRVRSLVPAGFQAGFPPPTSPIRDHAVVLGWSERLLSIMPVLVGGDPTRAPSRVAVLANQDRAAMAARLRPAAGLPRDTRVVCHRGDPGDPEALARVSPRTARSVVVLSADGSPTDRDAQLVRTLLALEDRRAGRPETGQVLACLSDPANLPAVRLAGAAGTRIVDVTDLAARLLVQTCLQPGLAAVYTNLLGMGGAKLHVQPEPALAGHTYGQAMHAYRTASVIGLRAGDGPVALNPHGQTPVRPGDRVIALAGDGGSVELHPEPPQPVGQPSITGYSDPTPGRSRVLVLGWNQRAGAVLFQLDQQLPPGSEVSVVTRHPAAATVLSQLAGHLDNLVLTFKDDDGAGRVVLDSLGIEVYDRVLVLCEDDAADPRTLLTLLHLRSLRDRLPADAGWPSVVAELADPSNRPLARATRADDVVVTELLVGLLVARIAGDPTGGPVYASLLDPHGARICLIPAERYVRLGEPVTFQAVVEAARWRWETAVGYRVAGSGPPGRAGVVLPPDKAAPLVLHPGDQVIVLAGA